jgi:hypothetical protein
VEASASKCRDQGGGGGHALRGGGVDRIRSASGGAEAGEAEDVFKSIDSECVVCMNMSKVSELC